MINICQNPEKLRKWCRQMQILHKCVWSSAEVRKSFLSLKHAAELGFDPAENEPRQVCCKIRARELRARVFPAPQAEALPLQRRGDGGRVQRIAGAARGAGAALEPARAHPVRHGAGRHGRSVQELPSAGVPRSAGPAKHFRCLSASQEWSCSMCSE